MAEETPEDRLESALERIAKVVDARGTANNGGSLHQERPHPEAAEVANRLDRIIDTLREALGQ